MASEQQQSEVTTQTQTLHQKQEKCPYQISSNMFTEQEIFVCGDSGYKIQRNPNNKNSFRIFFKTQECHSSALYSDTQFSLYYCFHGRFFYDPEDEVLVVDNLMYVQKGIVLSEPVQAPRSITMFMKLLGKDVDSYQGLLLKENYRIKGRCASEERKLKILKELEKRICLNKNF